MIYLERMSDLLVAGFVALCAIALCVDFICVFGYAVQRLHAL